MGKSPSAYRIFSLCLAACTPLSPPPLFARHAPVAAPDRGTFTVTLVVGFGGADLASGFGAELRAEWQATDDLAVGGALGGALGGAQDEDLPRTRLLGVRLLTRFGPSDWSSIMGGVGLSHASSGLVALTVDGGAALGFAIGDLVEPSIGVAGAVSIPLAQGAPFTVGDEPVLPTTTLTYGGNLGMGVHIGLNYLSGEVGAARASALGGRGATVYYFSAADGQGFR